MSPFRFSLALALTSLTSAHVVRRQAAGSLTTTPIPTEILTAGPTASIALLPSGTAISEAISSATQVTSTSSTPTPSKALEPCRNAGGKFAPFCEPTDGTSIPVDDIYYVTWDPSYFPSDALVEVEVSYADSSSNSEDPLYTSERIASSLGWAGIDVKSAWLQGRSKNNITFHIGQVGANDNSGSTTLIMDSPTVEITSTDGSSSSSNAPLGTSSSSKDYGHLGTVVGLTIGFSFLTLLLVSGLFIFYRRRQRNHRTYGIAQSRSQRLGEPKHREWIGQKASS